MERRVASLACNAYNICMQYAIRNVPDTLGEALRRAARPLLQQFDRQELETGCFPRSLAAICTFWLVRIVMGRRP